MGQAPDEAGVGVCVANTGTAAAEGRADAGCIELGTLGVVDGDGPLATAGTAPMPGADGALTELAVWAAG